MILVKTGGALWTQQRSTGVCYQRKVRIMEVEVTTGVI